MFDALWRFVMMLWTFVLSRFAPATPAAAVATAASSVTQAPFATAAPLTTQAPPFSAPGSFQTTAAATQAPVTAAATQAPVTAAKTTAPVTVTTAPFSFQITTTPSPTQAPASPFTFQTIAAQILAVPAPVTTAAPFSFQITTTPSPTQAPASPFTFQTMAAQILAVPAPVTTAAPVTTQPPVTRNPSIPTFWTDINYKGQYFQFPIGSYPSLASAGFPASYLSSLQVPSGLTVILYAGTAFQGRFLYVYSDTPDLTQANLNFNDLASSAVVYPGHVTPTPVPTPSPTTAAPMTSFQQRPLRWVSNGGWSLYLSCGSQASCPINGGVAYVEARRPTSCQLWNYSAGAIFNTIGQPLAVYLGSAMSIASGRFTASPGTGLYEWTWKPSASGYQLYNPLTQLAVDILASSSSMTNNVTVMTDPSKASGYWVVE